VEKTKKADIKAKKYTTYLLLTQIAWLKRHALDESERQGRQVTPAEVLREAVDEKIKREENKDDSN
jgi:hypothetical protein